MEKMRVCLCKPILVLLAAWATLNSALAKDQDVQSIPVFEDLAVLSPQCTVKNWQFRLHIRPNGLPENLATREVLIKVSAPDGRLWTQRYGASDILVRDCDAEQRICAQAKSASLHFRIGADGLPCAGTLMLVSAKRQLIAHRFNVRMEVPEKACRSGVQY